MTMSQWPEMRRNLVAILRGITPDEIEGIVGTLVEEGFEAIEIPLNSPEPFTSIKRAADCAPDNVLIGAGTVLAADQVRQLADVGGRLLVSPNVSPEVLDCAAGFGMVSMPGVMTPTEAFLALAHGASALKFFPASVVGTSGIAAMRAVLPKDTVVGAVGGVDDASFATYRDAGVSAFGLGSSLYKPGFSEGDVRRAATKAVAAYDEAFS